MPLALNLPMNVGRIPVGLRVALDLAVDDAGLFELEDVLEQDLVVVDPVDLGDVDDLARAVLEPGGVDDQVDRRRDLVADRPQRQLVAGHQDHRLEPAEHVRRGVGVAGRQRAVLAGRHRLEHVEGLARTTLADDDPVGSHVQAVAQQVADGDLAHALEVRRAGLELDDVRLVELQLGGILDRDDPLVLGDERRQHVEGRRLARSGPAGDEDVEPRLDAGPQELEHLGRRRPEADQVVDRDRLRRELPDGDDRPDQRQRLDDRVDARAVGQPRVHARARCVDAPAERGDDPVDDAQDVLVVQEVAVDPLDLAARSM